MTLIARVIGSEFHCDPRLEYSPTGFAYHFDAPFAGIGSVSPSSPVRHKLQAAALRELYDAWSRQRGVSVALFEHFDISRFRESRFITLAEIGADGSPRFIEIGQALIERLGDGLEDMASEPPERMLEPYRRCALEARPTYESSRFDFGDGDPVTFERLLVPFADRDHRISHVCGMVVIGGMTGAPVESPASTNWF